MKVPIYEAVLTTKWGNKLNIAPMGIRFKDGDNLTLFVFKTSHTHEFLRNTGVAVVNFVDNVEIIAKSVISDEVFPWDPAEKIDGWVLRDAYLYFEVRSRDYRDCGLMGLYEMEILLKRERRVPLLFNRASFAVIEGAIKVSRLGLYDREEIASFFRSYESVVLKTGGDREIRAWEYLVGFLRKEGIL